MIRALILLAVLFALGIGFVWIAERPGELVLTWQGYEVRTSVMAAVLGLVILIGLIVFFWRLVIWIVRSPHLLGRYMEGRRREHGLAALARGMVAVAAGDLKAARRSAADAKRLLSDTPLTRLLAAQAAQLSGDGDGARTIFEAMRDDPETEIVGLRGLFVEARRKGDHEAARHFVEEAHRTKRGLSWAGTALFEYQVAAGEWAGAMATLSANEGAGLVDKAAARRLRAVLLTGSALDAEEGEPDRARTEVLEAHRLAPELVPAAALAGRLLSRSGEVRRAVRILERAFARSPHPELAETYVHVRPGDAPRDRLRRARKLADIVPGDVEGALAVAGAAIAAREFDDAAATLAKLPGPMTERACLLMADIAEEKGDLGASREWLGRAVAAPRDPAWIADGQVFERWAPRSPISGRIDAFEWRVPTGPAPGAVIGDVAGARLAALPGSATTTPGPPVSAPLPSNASAPALPEILSQPKPETSPPPMGVAPAAATMAAGAVGMGARVPDDPGPELDEESTDR